MFWIGLGIGILLGLVLEVYFLALGVAKVNFYDVNGNEITNTEYRRLMGKK